MVRGKKILLEHPSAEMAVIAQPSCTSNAAAICMKHYAILNFSKFRWQSSRSKTANLFAVSFFSNFAKNFMTVKTRWWEETCRSSKSMSDQSHDKQFLKDLSKNVDTWPRVFIFWPLITSEVGYYSCKILKTFYSFPLQLDVKNEMGIFVSFGGNHTVASEQLSMRKQMLQNVSKLDNLDNWQYHKYFPLGWNYFLFTYYAITMFLWLLTV